MTAPGRASAPRGKGRERGPERGHLVPVIAAARDRGARSCGFLAAALRGTRGTPGNLGSARGGTRSSGGSHRAPHVPPRGGRAGPEAFPGGGIRRPDGLLPAPPATQCHHRTALSSGATTAAEAGRVRGHRRGGPGLLVF